jgi:Ser/Thr protein kinase RdoA (MazF antagonist)
VAHTHKLTFAAGTVTKRYTSWDRGEPRREWAALKHIHRHAPDLVPQPVAADLTGVPPTVTMTIVPGQPMTADLTPGHIRDLATAIRTLWAVPFADLTDIPPWQDDLPLARRLTDGPRPTEPTAAAAYDAALAWWHGPDPALLRTPPEMRILGHRDPNLANYLWDGHRVRIVDFEDAAVSDPATELALLAEHLSTRHVDTNALCTQLDVDHQRLRAARRLWAMFWLRLLLPGGPAARRNPPGTARAQAQRLLHLIDIT